MRFLAVLTLALALAACGRPTGSSKAPEAAPPPAPVACNDVAINPAAPARIVAAAAAAESLLGGPMAPGLYDLSSIEPRDGAPAPAADMWETIRVRDTEAGIVLEAAIVTGAAGNPPLRVNSTLVEGPPTELVRTCGPNLRRAVSYAASANGFALLLPGEGDVGKVLYTFARRAS
ncbi:MAG: hypothetical protein JNJ73_20100 [Hyphomonadaceae bacterium]|nr:hypothetical protein [Hyphomonadaceae bacterium]